MNKFRIERPIANIRLTKATINSEPSEDKLQKYRACYRKKGYIGKALRVNRGGYLVDDYEGYLVLKENNETTALVLVVGQG